MWAGAGAVSEASSGLSSWASVERKETFLPLVNHIQRHLVEPPSAWDWLRAQGGCLFG